MPRSWPESSVRCTGKRGMVVSQVKEAAEAGVAVLDAGGNAIEFGGSQAEGWACTDEAEAGQ